MLPPTPTTIISILFTPIIGGILAAYNSYRSALSRDAVRRLLEAAFALLYYTTFVVAMDLRYGGTLICLSSLYVTLFPVSVYCIAAHYPFSFIFLVVAPFLMIVHRIHHTETMIIRSSPHSTLPCVHTLILAILLSALIGTLFRHVVFQFPFDLF
jgi:hypothetical protein